RSSKRVGQRFEALKVIREAAKIKVTPELRDEAVAALVLPDAEIADEWEGWPEDTLHLAHDANFERYARMNKNGEVTVCRRTTQGEQVIAQLPARGEPLLWGLGMSRDGQFLAVGHSGRVEGTAGAVQIWRLDGPTPTSHLDVLEGMHLFAISFHADSRRLAIGHTDGRISIYDLQTKELLRRWKIDRAADSLAFHPSGSRLAAACKDSVRVYDAESGIESVRLTLPNIDSWSFGLAWHPEGRVLAATSDDSKIHFWDTAMGTEVMVPLEGQAGGGVFMAFNRTGDRLISTGWDKQARLWDAVTGR